MREFEPHSQQMLSFLIFLVAMSNTIFVFFWSLVEANDHPPSIDFAGNSYQVQKIGPLHNNIQKLSFHFPWVL